MLCVTSRQEFESILKTFSSFVAARFCFADALPSAAAGAAAAGAAASSVGSSSSLERRVTSPLRCAFLAVDPDGPAAPSSAARFLDPPPPAATLGRLPAFLLCFASLSLPSVRAGEGGGEGGGSPGGQSRGWTTAVEVVQEQKPSETRQCRKQRRSHEPQPVRDGGRGEGGEEAGGGWRAALGLPGSSRRVANAAAFVAAFSTATRFIASDSTRSSSAALAFLVAFFFGVCFFGARVPTCSARKGAHRMSVCKL